MSKKKKILLILIPIFMTILITFFGWGISYEYIRNLAVKYKFNLLVIVYVFVFTEILYDLGIFFILKGIGTFSVRWYYFLKPQKYYIFRQDLKKISFDFKNKTVLIGFLLNFLGSTLFSLYIIWLIFTKLPWFTWAISLPIFYNLTMSVLLRIPIIISGSSKDILIRSAKLGDVEKLITIDKKAWNSMHHYSKEHIVSQIKTFPEGILCALVDGTIEGFVVAEIINYDTTNPDLPNWYKITDNGFIKKTHNSKGNTLYGVSLSVLPKANPKVSKLLPEAIGKLAIKYNLKQAVLGGRIPSYHKYADKMTAEEYIQAKRKSGRPLDPEIYFYQKFGLKVIKTIPNYFKDPGSLNYGILLVWVNPFFGKPFSKLWSYLFKIK